jgi:hypothetical protein
MDRATSDTLDPEADPADPAERADTGGPAVPTSRDRPFPLVFVVLLVAGLVLRILTYNSTWGQPDGDQAMGVLMATRASQGHLALLFWGGNYGGTVITWVEAPVVALFGVKLWIFQAIDTGLALVAVFLLRSIGRHFLTPIAADVAAGTFWFFPALWLFWSSREYVFWLPAIVFALATGLVALRWSENRQDRRLLWATGLLAGLSIWSYPLVLPLVAPPLVLVLWALRKDLRGIAGVCLAGLVGISPWIAFVARHGRSALHVNTVSDSRASEVVHSVTQVLPTALVGGQIRAGVIWGMSDASAGHLVLLGVAIYAGAAVFTVVMAVRRQVAPAACGVSILLWPVALAAGHVVIGDATFRYGLIIVAPLLLVAAYLLSRIHLTLLLAVVALASVTYTISADSSGFAAAPSCNTELTATDDYLVAQHRTSVWASYWLAGPLTICSGGRVVASSVIPIRDEVAEADAAGADRSTFVALPGFPLDQELRTWTAAHVVPVTRTTTTGYAVWEFDTRVAPTSMGLDSSF